MKEKRNRIVFWGSISLIIIMVALVIIPMMTMRGTMKDTVQQVNEKYNDDFTMTWTNIDDHPMRDTFHGIMKSNNTGITYDLVVEDGVATLPYEEENYNAKINDVIEKTLGNSFSMANAKDGVLTARVLRSATSNQVEMDALAEQLKAEFNLTSISIETLEITEAQFKEAVEELKEYYQRSTVSKKETFEAYEPIVTEYQY